MSLGKHLEVLQCIRTKCGHKGDIRRIATSCHLHAPHARQDFALGDGATPGLAHSGRMAKIVPRDWQQLYAHPLYWLETFVDPARFKGTCYRAANWQSLGSTTGRGHNARTKERTQPVKELLGLPLTPRFRQLLSE